MRRRIQVAAVARPSRVLVGLLAALSLVTWVGVPVTETQWVETLTASGTVNTASQMQVIAIIDVDPDHLNADSDGNPITVYIELPDACAVADIDVATVRMHVLGETVEIPALAQPTEVGDHDHDGTLDRMVKFSRAAVVAMLGEREAGPVSLVVTGEAGWCAFDGSDVIILDPPDDGEADDGNDDSCEASADVEDQVDQAGCDDDGDDGDDGGDDQDDTCQASPGDGERPHDDCNEAGDDGEGGDQVNTCTAIDGGNAGELPSTPCDAGAGNDDNDDDGEADDGGDRGEDD